jgi:hypothetical protein
MHVVAAGMVHRHLVAVGICDGHRARKVRPGVFLDGQCVQFGPEQHGGPAAIGQDAHHAGAADAGLDGEAVVLQSSGDTPGGAVLGVGQFGMDVQILVEGLLVSCRLS